jgi:hypothetical protein
MSLDQDTTKIVQERPKQERLNNDEKEASMYYNDALSLGHVNLYEILGVPEIDGITDDFQRQVSDGYFVKTALADTEEEKRNIELASIILSNPILKVQYDFSSFAHSMKTFKPSNNYQSG